MSGIGRSPAGRALPASALAEPLHCVVLSCFTDEVKLLAEVLHYFAVRLHYAATLERADFLLTVTEARVVICDAVFLDGSWNDCVDMLAHLHPQVSLLVMADPVDAQFVSGALDRGACAVSWKPLRTLELRDLIRAASEASVERTMLTPASAVNM